MRKITFEDYLNSQGVIDFSLRAQRGMDGLIRFYIHPANCSGDTADFLVFDNSLHQINVIEKNETFSKN